MTDVEKTLEMLNEIADACKENRLKQLDMSSTAVKEMYDSYMRVGFNEHQALELTKVFLASTISRLPVR